MIKPRALCYNICLKWPPFIFRQTAVHRMVFSWSHLIVLASTINHSCLKVLLHDIWWSYYRLHSFVPQIKKETVWSRDLYDHTIGSACPIYLPQYVTSSHCKTTSQFVSRVLLCPNQTSASQPKAHLQAAQQDSCQKVTISMSSQVADRAHDSVLDGNSPNVDDEAYLILTFVESTRNSLWSDATTMDAEQTIIHKTYFVCPEFCVTRATHRMLMSQSLTKQHVWEMNCLETEMH